MYRKHFLAHWNPSSNCLPLLSLSILFSPLPPPLPFPSLLSPPIPSPSNPLSFPSRHFPSCPSLLAPPLLPLPSCAVPNYLRTKLSLELEGKQKERWSASSSKVAPEKKMEEIKSFNQMLSTALEHVREVEERKSKTGKWWVGLDAQGVLKKIFFN